MSVLRRSIFTLDRLTQLTYLSRWGEVPGLLGCRQVGVFDSQDSGDMHPFGDVLTQSRRPGKAAHLCCKCHDS